MFALRGGCSPAQGFLASPRGSPHPALVLVPRALPSASSTRTRPLPQAQHGPPPSPGCPASQPLPLLPTTHRQCARGAAGSFLQGPEFLSQRGAK